MSPAGGSPGIAHSWFKPPGVVVVEPPKLGGMLAPALMDNVRRGPHPTICEHGTTKSKCKKCKAFARICKHGKKKELCRECDGSALCIHDLRKKECRQCDGSALCAHNKIRRECKECGGSSFCEHGKRKRRCRDCGGNDFCPHDRRKGQCKECGGSQICEHNRQKFRCKDCYMCVHYRVKTRCPYCLASGDADKEMPRKIPRSQGWNAERLRGDGIGPGKGEGGVGEGEGGGGEGGRDQVMASLHPAGIKKLAPVGGLGGVKKSSVQRLGLQGEAVAESYNFALQNQLRGFIQAFPRSKAPSLHSGFPV